MSENPCEHQRKEYEKARKEFKVARAEYKDKYCKIEPIEPGGKTPPGASIDEMRNVKQRLSTAKAKLEKTCKALNDCENEYELSQTPCERESLVSD